MTHEPELDPETHADDTVMSVWKRRLLLAFLILLVVAVAAPTFGGCSGFFKPQEITARFTVNGREHEITREDFARFIQRYTFSMRALFGPYHPGLPDGEEGTKEALRKLMVDALAKDAGIEVPDATVTAKIEALPQFQTGGKFDDTRYREALAGFRSSLSHEDVAAMMKLELRGAEYVGLVVAAADLVPGDAAYDSWKARNQKITIEYVASPFAAQKAKIDAKEPTEAELASVTSMPRARELLAVPPRKTVEVAYIKVKDLTDEQFAAGKKYLEDAEILNDERRLEDEAFTTFFNKRDTVFTRERWGQVKDPGYPTKLREYNEKKAKWEKDDVATRGTLEDAPKDPAADYPTQEADQFLLWKERAEKEALAQLVMNELGRVAVNSGKALSETAAEFARFGVKVARNAEPYTDAEIVEKFPDPVARDSEFDIVVKSRLRAPGEGAPFKRQFEAQALPTARNAERIDDRGYMVISLEGADAARQYTFAEKPELMKDFWRKYQVAEAAKALADEIKKKAEAAGPEVEKRIEALRAAAKEAGLESATARRFSRDTPLPVAPSAAPGESLKPEVEAVAQRVKYRSFVQREYPLLLTLQPGKIWDPVFPDDKTEAVYVMLLVEKHEPSPVEMREADLKSARQQLSGEIMRKAADVVGFDALKTRLKLERFDEKEKPKESEKEKAESSEPSK